MAYFQLLKSQPFADMDELQEFWRALPKYLQEDPVFLAEYTQQLKKYNLNDEAEKLLRHKLNKKWDVNLFNIYIQTKSKDPAKQMAVVDQWGKKYEYDPITLRSLGFFFLRNQLWGQAKTYLEASLKQRPTLEAFLAMGMVMEKLGEVQKALFYYRKGFSIVES
jgi:HemY protein